MCVLISVLLCRLYVVGVMRRCLGTFVVLLFQSFGLATCRRESQWEKRGHKQETEKNND